MQTADPYFMISGKKVYKTSCLQAISSAQQLSKDRLRRVHGMSKYPEDKESGSNYDNYIWPLIANIVKIMKSNQVLKAIDTSHEMKNIEFTLKRIETEQIDGKMFWNSTSPTNTFQCTGDNCLPI